MDTACSKDISTHSCKLQLVNSKWKQTFVIRRASVCQCLVWPLEALGWLFVSLHSVCVLGGGRGDYRDPRLQGRIRVLQGVPYILWLQRANGFSQESWVCLSCGRSLWVQNFLCRFIGQSDCGKLIRFHPECQFMILLLFREWSYC